MTRDPVGDFEIVPTELAPGRPLDEELTGRPVPGRAWPRRAAGAAAALVVLALVRTSTHHRQAAAPGTPPAPGSSVPATPAPTGTTRPVTLSDLVGDRCPQGIPCGVTVTLSAGATTAFASAFAAPAITLQARAFGPGNIVYWQQIAASTPGGISIVATEQRTPTALPPAPLRVVRTSEATSVSVTTTRGRYDVNVYLTARQPVPASVVEAARHWATTTPLPR